MRQNIRYIVSVLQRITFCFIYVSHSESFLRIRVVENNSLEKNLQFARNCLFFYDLFISPEMLFFF